MQALVIGAGPAGLMAAETMAAAGVKVVVAEAKPSIARKFLMAGKSGLNLTKDEADFAAAYRCPELAPILADFGPEEVKAWARGLGQEVFTGSTGRVFPVAMKGSPLLRAWAGRLGGLGVELCTRWRWTGIDGGMVFATPGGRQVLHPRVTVLALGGASWSRLGSDGSWAPVLAEAGVAIRPFEPANFGLSVSWSPHMERLYGQAVKGVALDLPDRRERGEFVITLKGLEGGGLYALSRDIRAGRPVTLDFFPDLAPLALEARIARQKPGETLFNRLRKLLPAPAAGLVMEWGRGLPLHQALKALPLRHDGPRPLDEAISTAGGIDWAALDGLQLRALPGVFVAGEMVDWEAPTGGYLLTACLAMGRAAGRQATPLAIS